MWSPTFWGAQLYGTYRILAEAAVGGGGKGDGVGEAGSWEERKHKEGEQGDLGDLAGVE